MSQKITTAIKVDVTKENNNTIFIAKQGDTARYLDITLQNNETTIVVPLTSIVTFNVHKADDTYADCTATVNSDGTVNVHLTDQMLSIADMIICDLLVIDPTDSSQYSTPPFKGRVLPVAVNSDIPESSDVFQALTDALVAANAILPVVIVRSAYDALIAASTWEVGRRYDIYED